MNTNDSLSSCFEASNNLIRLYQIGIRHEVRRVTVIALIDKELKNGDITFDPVYRYDELSPERQPRWEQVDDLDLAHPG